jgi:hypothetical protein
MSFCSRITHLPITQLPKSESVFPSFTALIQSLFIIEAT